MVHLSGSENGVDIMCLKCGTLRPNRWPSETLADSDQFREQICSVCWKLLEPRRRCLVRINAQSLRELAVCGFEPSEPLIGCELLAHNQRISAVCERGGLVARDQHPPRCSGGLLHLWQAQNAHATVQLAVVFAVCFNATLLPEGSDERQRSGGMKAVGRWFESGRCVWAT